MSLEGGKFKCHLHKYETSDVEKWDTHCYKYREEHTLSVEQNCPNCGTKNVREIPYPKNYVEKAHSPTGSGILLECKKCFGVMDRRELT